MVREITRQELEQRIPDPEDTDVLQGIWRVADPKITLASMASLTVGLSVAWHDGGLAWGWAALTVLGIFFVEAAKNASGEIVDWWSGTDVAITEEDRSPFSGGKRVIVDGLMTPRQTAAVAAGFYTLAAAIGVAIVIFREPAVLWFGLVGFALAYFYHAPPFKLSYRGLGELAVGVAYGPVIAAGAYLVQHGVVTAEVVALSVPLGMLVAAFLWINEYPDYRADKQAGKRTLVVRLGREAASRAFAGIVIAAFGLLLALPLFGAPWWAWLGLIGLPLGWRALRRLLAHPTETERIVPAQAWTLLSFVLYAVGVAAGMLVAA